VLPYCPALHYLYYCLHCAQIYDDDDDDLQCQHIIMVVSHFAHAQGVIISDSWQIMPCVLRDCQSNIYGHGP